jgi:hypothetical protein
MEEPTVDSLSEFTNCVREIRKFWNVPPHEELWFRGEAEEYDSRLRPKLYRPLKGGILAPPAHWRPRTVDRWRSPAFRREWPARVYELLAGSVLLRGVAGADPAAKGIGIWFDMQCLLAGTDWEKGIQQGLQRCSELVLELLIVVFIYQCDPDIRMRCQFAGAVQSSKTAADNYNVFLCDRLLSGGVTDGSPL